MKPKIIFLVLSILLGFVFILSITTIYVSDAIQNNNACGCVIPIPYMILILASLGLFVGFFSAYLLLQREESTHEQVRETLRFLPTEERKVVQVLSKGDLRQAELEKVTGLHKVKLHRTIRKLKEKDIVEKKRSGKINTISLKEDLKGLFQ
jgi:uncharacterized membrane protein